MPRQTRLERGRRRGEVLVARMLREMRDVRVAAGLTHDEIAKVIGVARSNVTRLEAGKTSDVGIVRLSEMASVLGYEISVGLHPIGDPVRDKGQLACGRRFEALLSDRWRVTDETLLPGAGERRAWDKLLRLINATPPYVVGVDIESRAWDVQAIVRRTRGRERDGHVDAILLVLADTAHNRRIVDELRSALGPEYATSPRSLMAGLRKGGRLTGCGLILI